MPEPVDAFAHHLSFLLSVVDLDARLRPPLQPRLTMATAVSLIRRASHASRVSYFEVEGGDDDEHTSLAITRVARATEHADAVEPFASYHPGRAALLLASAQTGSAEALGPLADDEPFYAAHATQEPLATRFVAFAPVLAYGRFVGVLEAARGDGTVPFDDDALRSVEEGAAMIGQLAASAGREQTIEAMFAAILPEVFDPKRAPTSLPARLRTWIAARRVRPDDREALGLAVSIAELAARAPAAIALARSIVTACGRVVAPVAPAAWGSLDHARR